MRRYIIFNNIRISTTLCLSLLALIVALAAGTLIYRQASISRWAQEHGQEALEDFAAEASLAKMDALPKKYKNLARAKNRLESSINKEIDVVLSRYDSGGVSFEQLMNSLHNYGLISGEGGYVAQALESAEIMKANIDAYEEALTLVAGKNYAKALSLLRSVTGDTPLYLEKAVSEIGVVETLVKDETMLEVKALLLREDAAGARELADAAIRQYPENLKLEAVYDYIDRHKALMSSLTPYNEPVEHVFMRPLIAFPEITYRGNDMTAAYDADCLTPGELKKILLQLYDNGFMLIDINMLLEGTGENGAPLTRAQLMLPEGKKPLILSIDDVAYDERKAGRGMVDKLIVDENGKVASYTKMANGEEIISYDNEVFPIVDAFCEEYPDFSFRGAKGTLSLTGFQGILGYRTQRDAPEGTDRESEKAAAIAVVEALKQSGWTFGSHSYSHAYMSQRLSYAGVKEDTERWETEVRPLVGDTRLFFFPYGDTIVSTDPKFQILYDAGFRIFGMVGSGGPFLKLSDNGLGLFQDRRSLDGYSLRYFKDYFKGLFDTESVIDPIRG